MNKNLNIFNVTYDKEGCYKESNQTNIAGAILTALHVFLPELYKDYMEKCAFIHYGVSLKIRDESEEDYVTSIVHISKEKHEQKKITALNKKMAPKKTPKVSATPRKAPVKKTPKLEKQVLISEKEYNDEKTGSPMLMLTYNVKRGNLLTSVPKPLKLFWVTLFQCYLNEIKVLFADREFDTSVIQEEGQLTRLIKHISDNNNYEENYQNPANFPEESEKVLDKQNTARNNLEGAFLVNTSPVKVSTNQSTEIKTMFINFFYEIMREVCIYKTGNKTSINVNSFTTAIKCRFYGIKNNGFLFPRFLHKFSELFKVICSQGIKRVVKKTEVIEENKDESESPETQEQPVDDINFNFVGSFTGDENI